MLIKATKMISKIVILFIHLVKIYLIQSILKYKKNECFFERKDHLLSNGNSLLSKLNANQKYTNF